MEHVLKYAFIVSIPIAFILLVLVMFYYRTGALRKLEALAYLLFPVIILSNMAFHDIGLYHKLSFNITQHSCVLFIYGVYLLVLLFLNLNGSYIAWKNGDEHFHKMLKNTYIKAAVFTALLVIASGFDNDLLSSLNNDLLSNRRDAYIGYLMLTFMVVPALKLAVNPSALSLLFFFGLINLGYSRAIKRIDRKDGLYSNVVAASFVFLILGVYPVLMFALSVLIIIRNSV